MSQVQISSTLSPSITIILHDKRPATTSLEIAKIFDKRHDAVLRDIRNISSNCPEIFCAHNFVETSQTVEMPNGGTRAESIVLLHRDGFMLLVMGYTGKKALTMKLAYIEAFNAMEAQLQSYALSEASLPPSAPSLTPSTPADRAPLWSLVNAWSSISGQPGNTLWPQVLAHFQLSKLEELPVEHLPAALAFVQARIDGLPKALPPVSDKPALRQRPKTGPVWNELNALIAELDEMNTLSRHFENLLRRANHISSSVYEATYTALGWHSHIGFSADPLAECLGNSFYNSLGHMRTAFEDARRYLCQQRTLARLRGL